MSQVIFIDKVTFLPSALPAENKLTAGDVNEMKNAINANDNWRGNFDLSGDAYPSSGGTGAAGIPKAGNQWYISVAGEVDVTGLGVVTVPVGTVITYVGGTVTLAASWNVRFNASDLGLDQVDNTSDVNKPVSTAQAAAITVVQNDVNAHEARTDNPHSVSKTQVGLGSVDNTADAAKPVSTAQQSALDLKANLASPTFTGTVSGITKSMVGLGNVDNTADTAKPVSTAQQTALDGKQATLVSGTNIKTVNGVSVLGSGDISIAATIAAAIAAAFVIGEVPTGAVDGVNLVFSIVSSPISGKAAVYRNGSRQKILVDYSQSGNVFTFVNAPETGDIILIDSIK
jgi:hypothetical protein